MASPITERFRRSVPATEPPPKRWARRYQAALAGSDVVAIGASIFVGYVLRFSSASPTPDYFLCAVVIAVGWLLALQNAGGYQVEHLGVGPNESKIVLRASGLTLGLVAVFCYALKLDLARGFVVQVIPVGVLLLIAGRLLVRREVARHRSRGQWTHRILAVGTRDAVEHLVETTRRAPTAGLSVIGACAEDMTPDDELALGIPVLGGVLDAATAAAEVGADVVAVAGSGLGPGGVRELGWRLEGTGRGLVVAPALTEIAGPRVRVSPVEGLPLMWVDQPRLRRLSLAVKRSLDLLAAGGLLVLLLPVLLASAIAIKLDSRGPVFFRQKRLGINGQEFTILKLRTMCADAEHRRAEIMALNEQDGGGVLFKIRADPRITRVGGVLRKLSIDELPQLFQVLGGTMSLVGPRPLAAADSTYDGHARRRLLVRPGVTGLWQVSGRSDTSWDNAVRLDLYYVENWSLGLDLGIMARTVWTVLRGRGAY